MKITRTFKAAALAALAVMTVSCVDETDFRSSRQILIDVTDEVPSLTKSDYSETETVDLSFDDVKLTLTATATPVSAGSSGSYETRAAAVNSADDISSFSMKISSFADVATVEKTSSNAWGLKRVGDQHYLWPDEIPAGGLCFDSYYGSGASISGHTVSYSMTDSDLLIGRTFAAKNNVPIHLYHPLAALRFKIHSGFLEGFEVTDIKLSSLYTTGQFTLPSTGTVDQAVDLSAPAWTGLGNAQELHPDVYQSAADEFFIIPQTTEGVTMTITFKQDGGQDKILTVDMPDVGLADGKWQAGYFYTYSISGGGYVEVEAVDEMDGDESSSTGAAKTGVRMLNNGSLPVYVRAYVAANWLNNAGRVVAPYTGAIAFDTSSWDLASDGFYYYDRQVLPDTATDNLIDSFTPDVTTAPTNTGFELHAEMQVIFQAVEVDKVSEVWSGFTIE